MIVSINCKNCAYFFLSFSSSQWLYIQPIDFYYMLRTMPSLYQLILLAISAPHLVLAANSWIVPGAAWMSTSNTKIDAHGGMVLQRGDTFYWVGQAASHSAFS